MIKLVRSVGVISISEELYSTRRLMEAAAKIGLRAHLINPIRVTLEVGGEAGTGRLLEDGQPLPVPELVIPRVGSRLTEWSLALLDALIAGGARSPVSADKLALAADKLRTAQALAAAGVPVVPTVALREPAHVDGALATIGGPPVVIKLKHGTQGTGVMSGPDQGSATSILDALMNLGHTALVQRRVEMSHPRDLRVLIAAGEPLAACWRHAREGEFRSNVHRGGQTSYAKLSMQAADIAIRAARAVGLPYCGVDLLPIDSGSGRGFQVLEVNGSPGFEGIEKANHGADLARPFLEAMLQ